MSRELKLEFLETDVLIVGGGTAGCYSALTIAENSNLNVIVLEKANIKRSGCLAAGVNAINAYITKGKKPEDYVDYASNDAEGEVREDLLLTMASGLNDTVHKLEELGLVILKDENNQYVTRGDRNIKINGENIKPILAKALKKYKNINVLNKVNAIDYHVEKNKILGAFCIGVEEEKLIYIKAKKVICATGGASGIYRPNNPGFSRHKMWYSPFNTGAGYAMGLRAGAEMTSFEMRFIALRCKDTIAPTGTLAQGVGAKQVNALGEIYESKYGLRTYERIYGTVMENLEGRGPCYLKTVGITKEKDEDLKKAYLNMAPSQTLKWIERELSPSEENVEIEGTEPYIVGGHTSSGYWVSTSRETTIKGLFAAGDVAGGCPQKYVSGALVEGEIAAREIIKQLKKDNTTNIKVDVAKLIEEKRKEISIFLEDTYALYTVEELEDAMQKVMDSYAGGIGTSYQYTVSKLNIAEEKIKRIQKLTDKLKAKDMHELMFIYELKDRLLVALTVIAHLKEGKLEGKYINSKLTNGEVEILIKDLVKRGEKYEHSY